MAENDKLWLAQYREGRVEALGELVEAYRRPLYAFILKMTGNPSQAEEVFQEVWFRAIRALPGYREDRFLSWLFRIAHNCVIDGLRRRKPEASLQDGDAETGTLEQRIAAPGLGPDALAEGLDLGERIRQAVNGLPPEQREVFLMRTEGDLPFKEIARIQGCSINTALARMQYALGKLREELKTEFVGTNREPT